MARPGFRGIRTGSAYHAQDWKNYFDALPALVERLQGVVIERKDAIDLMLEADTPATLHYVDPPYVSAVRQRRQRKVYAHEMDDHGHRVMAALLNRLKGMVVLSGYEGDLYDELFDGWSIRKKKVFGEKAVSRTECLWLNPAAVAGQAQPMLEGHR